LGVSKKVGSLSLNSDNFESILREQENKANLPHMKRKKSLETTMNGKTAAQLFRERQKEHQDLQYAEVLRLEKESAFYTSQALYLKQENEILAQRQLFLRLFLQEFIQNHEFKDREPTFLLTPKMEEI